jgi:uncharacterized protein YndB with AHSA1/START domain
MADKPSLTLRRRFNASPALVFGAWTDPKQLVRWFGPENVVALRAEADLRVGGKYRVVMRSDDGNEHDVSGVYREIVPNEKLVFTWAWRSTPERESLVTVTIQPDGDGALLTLTHSQLFDETAAKNHEHGWTGSLNKLEKFFA